jgi:hypothetical protein
MDADVAALIGAETRSFHVAGEPEPEIFAFGARLLLLDTEFGATERIDRHAQRFAILAAVQRHFQPVGEQQSFARIGELPLGNKIAAADFEAVDAEFLGELIHGALDGKAGLRPSAAAIRRHLHGRRVDRLELDPDVRDAIGARDRRGGNLRYRDTVGDERAGVVQKAVTQSDHLAGLERRKLDGVDLRALL